MSVKIFPSGPLVTNAYVFFCPDTHHAAIIDAPPQSSEKIIEFCKNNNLTPKKILLTHSHWDHIAEISGLKKHYKVPVLIHSFDAPNLENPGSDRLPLRINIEGVSPDVLIKEGDMIKIGNLTLKVIYTPGHSPGCVCFFCPENKVLFSGDTLFQGTIGNLSLPTCQPDLMWDSLKKLSELPPETIVYPGHGRSTTIGNESWLSNAEEIFGDF